MIFLVIVQFIVANYSLYYFTSNIIFSTSKLNLHNSKYFELNNDIQASHFEARKMAIAGK